jgi:CTP:molybdopterin cytidylyltransferase MocA
VLFSSHFKEDILLLEDKSGCKPVVIANKDLVIEVPFSTNNCHIDIDTMEDYKRIL